jgi:hypothetical protein
MRTKTLLLSAAVGAAGLLAASAQVYSVNSVGYVNMNLPAGFSLISNPLDAASNTLSALVPNVPFGTTVFQWNETTSNFDSSIFLGSWTVDLTMEPGAGAFIQLGAATTLTFVGEVMQGSLSNPIPAGYSIRSSQVPQEGALSSDLGFPASFGDTVFLFNRTTQGYDSYIFLGTWQPSEPNVTVGESFFVSKGAAGSWNRTFSVN